MLMFLACVGIVIVSSLGLNYEKELKAQEEIVFPAIGDEKAVARELEREARHRREAPVTSNDFADQGDLELELKEQGGKEHGCRVERSYKCKGDECEKEYKSKCFERGK